MALSNEEKQVGRWYASGVNNTLWAMFTKDEVLAMTDPQFENTAANIATKAYESAKQMILVDRNFTD